MEEYLIGAGVVTVVWALVRFPWQRLKQRRIKRESMTPPYDVEIDKLHPDAISRYREYRKRTRGS